VVVLQIPELDTPSNSPTLARLRYAYSEALNRAAREREAATWRERAMDSDRDGTASLYAEEDDEIVDLLEGDEDENENVADAAGDDRGDVDDSADVDGEDDSDVSDDSDDLDDSDDDRDSAAAEAALAADTVDGTATPPAHRLPPTVEFRPKGDI